MRFAPISNVCPRKPHRRVVAVVIVSYLLDVAAAVVQCSSRDNVESWRRDTTPGCAAFPVELVAQ